MLCARWCGAALTLLLPAGCLNTGVTVVRRPPNAKNVTMYALRPAGLALDIREKDSADAAGDLFFYITDRLTTPYACRRSNDSAFMCQDFQKVLQTNDQVYTKIVVEVDSTYGGCPGGSVECSQYSDCNPVYNTTSNSSNVQFQCYCGEQHHSWLRGTGRELPHRLSSASNDYWRCSDWVSSLDCFDMRTSQQCNACVQNQSSAAARASHGCTDRFVHEACDSDYYACTAAIRSNETCAAYNHSLSKCTACAHKHTKDLEGKCVNDYVNFGCLPRRSCQVVGKLKVDTRYCSRTGKLEANGTCPTCADACDGAWSLWKTYTSALLGGFWYSTPAAADCDKPSPSAGVNCAWRLVQTNKTVNATCVNNNVHALVESSGASCFQGCPQPTNSTSDCWIECFFRTLLGRDALDPEKIVGEPMSKEAVVKAWLAGFTSDDPTKGGCPALGFSPASILLV